MDRVKTESLTGAEIVVRCLQEEGVDCVFGYPGGAVLCIYDELFKQDKVRHVLVRHEQGAAHAADGYSRSSHKVGVCLVTSGPGVTNAVTGIATAYMDSIPMVVLTGQVPTHAIGLDAFQEVRHGRHHAAVREAQLPRQERQRPRGTIKKAFYLATTGRPGRCWSTSRRTSRSTSASSSIPRRSRCARTARCAKGHAGQIKKALQLILEAKRPMVYTGGGVILSNAAPQLTEFVRLLGFPCTNTLMGLGLVPCDRPQFLGMPGMHGTYEDEHGDAALRRADRDRRAVRRPRDRRPGALSRRTRARSSTSTSTRRRSPSASRSTFRSSAT
jgi:acetolactate synthase-1/2/3 large subunit